jgi:hypothetical protein
VFESSNILLDHNWIAWFIQADGTFGLNYTKAPRMKLGYMPTAVSCYSTWTWFNCFRKNYRINGLWYYCKTHWWETDIKYLSLIFRI